MQTAGRVRSGALPATRQVCFIDLARGYSDLGRGQDAVRMLLRAERVAPQHVRSSTAAGVTAQPLPGQLRQAAGGSALHGLCERIGVSE
jgi:hypothetical protein